MATHVLKTDSSNFSKTIAGVKSFECCLNDRNFSIGDTVVLLEFDVASDVYSGRSAVGEIVFILDEFIGVNSDYVVFQLRFFPSILINPF